MILNLGIFGDTDQTSGYNEMIKLWASLGEYAYYGLTGRLPEKNIKSYRAVQLLKSVLFE